MAGGRQLCFLIFFLFFFKIADGILLGALGYYDIRGLVVVVFLGGVSVTRT